MTLTFITASKRGKEKEEKGGRPADGRNTRSTSVLCCLTPLKNVNSESTLKWLLRGVGLVSNCFFSPFFNFPHRYLLHRFAPWVSKLVLTACPTEHLNLTRPLNEGIPRPCAQHLHSIPGCDKHGFVQISSAYRAACLERSGKATGRL